MNLLPTTPTEDMEFDEVVYMLEMSNDHVYELQKKIIKRDAEIKKLKEDISELSKYLNK